MILLDTDVMIDVLRKHPGAEQWLESVDETILLPGFVVMELIQGCKNTNEQQRLEKTLADHRTIWPDQETLENAMELFSRFYLSHGIGIMDSLIAQTAIGLGLPLHTFNEKHFSVVSDLKTIQPYKK